MADSKAINRYAFQLFDQVVIRKLKKKAIKKIAGLNVEYFYTKEPVPFGEKDKYQTTPIHLGEIWAMDNFGCAWFHFTGKVPDSAKGQHVAINVTIGGEGCFYDKNGNPISGITTIGSTGKFFHVCKGKTLFDISKYADGGEEIDVWMDAGNNKTPSDTIKTASLTEASIVIVRDDIVDLFYRYNNLAMIKPYISHLDVKHQLINKTLLRATRYSSDLGRNGIAYANQIIDKRGAELGSPSPYHIYATGHGHIDLAFLWPIRETKRKIIRTFVNQLKNMEKYPSYVFGASQPQQFEWIEQLQPELFERIKEKVFSGNIELQGGMWVETDTNLPSGESLVRQCLYGQKYWQEKFDRRVKVCWLPDSFGYNAALPQIIKKSGMDYFLTTKLSWNKNKFPYHSFMWEGIDGTKVLAHFPPENCYSGEGIPFTTIPSIKENKEKDVAPCWSMLFGMGDGGGGPSNGHLATITEQQKTKMLPDIQFAPALKCFEELDNYKDKFETYKGELYLERHRGTYTTQAKNKYYNKKLEYLLHNAEFISVIAEKYANITYPKTELDTIWKEVLLYQFHDILPGSSIERVYTESIDRYKKLEQSINDIITMALDGLEDKESTERCVLNNTGYSLRKHFNINGKTYYSDIVPYGTSELMEYIPNSIKSLMQTDNSIENGLILITFNQNGEIKSIIDKLTNKEFSGSYMNKLQVYNEKDGDAWDFYMEAYKHPSSEFKFVNATNKIGDDYVQRETLYKYSGSTITQTITLYDDSKLIEFNTTVDWLETHKMLRANFLPTVFPEKVLCDIQFGNILRSTTENNSIEREQFEICAHKWIDLSENDVGIAFISDYKYGWRVKSGLVSLNLLRSSTTPGKDADKGSHSFKYALYPHDGNAFDADIPKIATMFNNPPKVVTNKIKQFSFVKTTNNNIIIDTIKKSEDGTGIVVRVYENEGKVTQTSICFENEIISASETNMLEDIITENINLNELYFSPFEIKTILVKLA